MPFSEDAFDEIVKEWATRSLKSIEGQKLELAGLKLSYIDLYFQAVGEKGLKKAHQHNEVYNYEKAIYAKKQEISSNQKRLKNALQEIDKAKKENPKLMNERIDRLSRIIG